MLIASTLIYQLSGENMYMIRNVLIPDMNYVIRDRDGFFYKLRFIDFNNDMGEKGYPKFEYVRL